MVTRVPISDAGEAERIRSPGSLLPSEAGQLFTSPEDEITMREGAQEELRRAHAELEMRIDRRTAELAAANALLQKEVTEHQRAEELLRELTGRLFQL